MDLQIVWFILVTVLFVGFFFLEGFDYGVGTILPFFAKNEFNSLLSLSILSLSFIITPP